VTCSTHTSDELRLTKQRGLNELTVSPTLHHSVVQFLYELQSPTFSQYAMRTATAAATATTDAAAA